MPQKGFETYKWDYSGGVTWANPDPWADLEYSLRIRDSILLFVLFVLPEKACHLFLVWNNSFVLLLGVRRFLFVFCRYLFLILLFCLNMTFFNNGFDDW